jgi:hypothetical protein
VAFATPEAKEGDGNEAKARCCTEINSRDPPLTERVDNRFE